MMYCIYASVEKYRVCRKLFDNHCLLGFWTRAGDGTANESMHLLQQVFSVELLQHTGDRVCVVIPVEGVAS